MLWKRWNLNGHINGMIVVRDEGVDRAYSPSFMDGFSHPIHEIRLPCSSSSNRNINLSVQAQSMNVLS